MAMPAVGRFSGTPASINASEVPQTVAIEDEPFDLGDLRDHAQRVGELVVRRQDRMDRAPGELAVTDLAPARPAHAAGFTHREGREVVVQQEGFLIGPLQSVDELLVLAGTQRGNHQRLGFAAGEQRRAMGARQHADFGHDRADRLQIASVDAFAGVEDVPAHDLGFQRSLNTPATCCLSKLGFGALREEMRHDLLLGGFHRLLTHRLLAPMA